MNLYHAYTPLRNSEESEIYQKFIEILYTHNLITKRIYEDLGQFPLPGSKETYLGALYLANKLSDFYQEFTTEKQLAFVEALVGRDGGWRSGMLNSNKQQKLIRDIKAEKMETYLDFFKYCYGCEFIDLTRYRGSTKKLIKKLTGTLNNLCYEFFTIVEITLKEEALTAESGSQNTRAILIIDTGAKKHQSSYTYHANDGRLSQNLYLLLDHLLNLVNQLLTDYTCSYRFTSVHNTLSHSFPKGKKEMVVICRVEQTNAYLFEFMAMQNRFLSNTPLLAFYDFPLSYTRIEYIIYHFSTCGLLAHLTEVQMNEVIRQLYQTTYQSIASLIAVFPDTITVVNDSVCPGQKPYLTFLKSLTTISRGVLAFNDIEDGLPEHFDDKTETKFKVSFKCDGRYHEVACSLTFQYFDQTLIHYVINEIIRKDYPDYQLTDLQSGTQQQDFFLFASKKQIEYLKKMNLLQAWGRF